MMTSPAPTDDAISKLVSALTSAYEAATPGRAKRWWAGGFGWLKPGVSAEESVSPGAQAFIVAAHNAMPTLLAALRALDAERQAARERESRVRQALDDLEQAADETASSTQAMLKAGRLNSPETLPDALILMGRATGTKGTVQHIRAVLDAPARALEGDDDERQ